MYETDEVFLNFYYEKIFNKCLRWIVNKLKLEFWFKKMLIYWML